MNGDRITIMENFDELIKEYAHLVISKGLNLHKGQRLLISCPVECAEFARICTSEAYHLGCKEVIVRWKDDDITRKKFLFAAEEVFDAIEPWEVLFFNSMAEEKACWLRIHAENPENMKNVDTGRIRRAQVSIGKTMEVFRKAQMKNLYKWCVCSVPIKSWAKTVFKNLSEEDAVTKLWEEVFSACRIVQGNSENNWKEHTENLKKHIDILNEYSFKKLHYKSSAGTDVIVELIDNSFWSGGREKTPDGETFSANIPSEEVFISPKKNGVNGTIVATKPLIYKGALIDGFSFLVKDGRIIDVHADVGEDVLRDAISVDEGASYFGEIALVPYNSPISQSGLLFYCTLFDENASCHFAFGRGFPCIEGADKMSEEEIQNKGINYSITHVDFMIGTSDMWINGITKEGAEVPVFRNGNFAF